MLEVHTPLLEVTSPWTLSSSELTADVGEMMPTEVVSFSADNTPVSATAVRVVSVLEHWWAASANVQRLVLYRRPAHCW